MGISFKENSGGCFITSFTKLNSSHSEKGQTKLGLNFLSAQKVGRRTNKNDFRFEQ